MYYVYTIVLTFVYLNISIPQERKMAGLNPLPYEKRGKCLRTCIFHMKNNNMLIATHNDSSMSFRK